MSSPPNTTQLWQKYVRAFRSVQAMFFRKLFGKLCKDLLENVGDGTHLYSSHSSTISLFSMKRLHQRYFLINFLCATI